jgi:ABC-type antimicrobial peptide transport system permease subunit
MRDVLNGSYSVTYTRLLSILLSTFAVLSLFIAAFGLYGISSYAVTERRRELAIRSAIGASGARLMRHVLQQSAYVLGVGLLLGGVGAFFATRSLESALFGVSGLPILTVLSAAAVLSVAAGLGISIPTFRAGRIDPVQILKQQ